jgi:hypothetical protein
MVSIGPPRRRTIPTRVQLFILRKFACNMWALTARAALGIVAGKAWNWARASNRLLIGACAVIGLGFTSATNAKEYAVAMILMVLGLSHFDRVFLGLGWMG